MADVRLSRVCVRWYAGTSNTNHITWNRPETMAERIQQHYNSCAAAAVRCAPTDEIREIMLSQQFVHSNINRGRPAPEMKLPRC